MTDKAKQEFREETAKSLYYIRTCSYKYPAGRDWGKCRNKELWLRNADETLAKAEPLNRQDERMRIYQWLEANVFNYYADFCPSTNRVEEYVRIDVMTKDLQALKGEGKANNCRE